MQSTFFSVRSLRVLLFVLSLCCFVSACAGRSNIAADVQSSAALGMQAIPQSSTLWVSVENSTESADSGESLRAMLVTFLQSDAGIRMADNEAAADYILRVKVVQVGLIGSTPASMDLTDGLGSAATGAMLGLAVGSVISPRGAGWGTGAGLVLGLGVGYTKTANDNEDTWSMAADVQLENTKNVKNSSNKQPVSQSRMEANVQGVNLTREVATPALEDALAQEIAKQFRKEPS